MKIIGFNINEINATIKPEFKRSAINTNIEFVDIKKEDVDFLKDQDALNASFKFSVIYKDTEKKDKNNQGEIFLNGKIALSVTKEESKEFIKSWKKKEVPKDKVIPIYNFILRKCSIRSLQIQEDLGLPSHLPIPQVKPGEKQ
jgi:hypothetical protein